VELLVVIGIIAVLVAILLPALAKARTEARSIQCASRLHQILVACSAYLVDTGKYPCNYVNDPYSMCFPHDQQSRTLNELAAYMGHFPDITDATLPEDLPSQLVCPFAEISDPTGRKWIGNGNTYWYTGYGYYARLDEHQNYPGHVQDGILRFPDHAADARGVSRGVVWADAVSWDGGVGGQGMWYYTHTRGQYGFNSIFTFWHDRFSAFAGQHLAYSDGSVVWQNTTDINPADFTQNVAYWDGIDYYWWF
jgi:type II secretory pathway pseudopilin PulG